MSSLHPKVDERDLFEFFSAVGRVTDIRLIRDQRTRKSKGLCYIEFAEKTSVADALSLNGQPIGSISVRIERTQAEKNHKAEAAGGAALRLLVGGLHFAVTDRDLALIFGEVGTLDFVDLQRDPATKKSLGFGFVQYQKAIDAKTALLNLDGLEIAGRALKVRLADDAKAASASPAPVVVGPAPTQPPMPMPQQQPPPLIPIAPIQGGPDLDSAEGGLAFTAQSRAALMQRLNRGSEIPKPGRSTAPAASERAPSRDSGIIQAKELSVPKIQPTECVVIRNMFDPATETDPEFYLDIQEDVEQEVSRHGRIKHVFVDKDNPKGVVYVRVDSAAAGAAVVKALHGRWFAQRSLTAECVIPSTYEMRFPESRKRS